MIKMSRLSLFYTLELKIWYSRLEYDMWVMKCLLKYNWNIKKSIEKWKTQLKKVDKVKYNKRVFIFVEEQLCIHQHLFHHK